MGGILFRFLLFLLFQQGVKRKIASAFFFVLLLTPTILANARSCGWEYVIPEPPNRLC